MFEFAVFLLASLASAGLTGAAMKVALRRGVMDLPNARSSHVVPVPRGGGVAVVVVCIAGVMLLGSSGFIGFRTSALLIVAGAAIALVGALDDLKGLPPMHRFSVHIGASAAFLAGLYWDRIIAVDSVGLLLLGVLMVLGMAWSINLFNFMDGIDGIAASQAIFVSAASALVAVMNGASDVAALPMLAAGASFGFLLWNWSPARIFMGDAGSGFLGFWLAAMALFLSSTGAVNIWTSIILNAVFIADASATLLRRMLTGRRWYEAHRSHVYQQLCRRWQSHRKVVVVFHLVNIIFVLPLAVLSSGEVAHAPEFAMTVLALLTAVAGMLRAGAPTDDGT